MLRVLLSWSALACLAGGGGGGGYNPVNPGTGEEILPVNASLRIRRLVLASVLIHEGLHSVQYRETQSRPKPPAPPPTGGPPPDPYAKQFACREIEAHDLQLLFLELLLWNEFLTPRLTADELEALRAYEKFVREERERYVRMKKTNGG
jgi:hypothetical protein